MGKFLPGLFIGVAIGLLIAPKKGDELRHELAGCCKQLQNKISHATTPANDTSTIANNDTRPIILPANTPESNSTTTDSMDTNNTSNTPLPPNVSSLTPNAAPTEALKDTRPNTSKPYSKSNPANPTQSRSNTPYQAAGKRSTPHKSQTNTNQNRSHN